MIYDLIGGDRDGQVLRLTHEAENIRLMRMPDPCVLIDDRGREPNNQAIPVFTYTLRLFDFYGQPYKCYALDVLTDLQARNIAIKRVMA